AQASEPCWRNARRMAEPVRTLAGGGPASGPIEPGVKHRLSPDAFYRLPGAAGLDGTASPEREAGRDPSRTGAGPGTLTDDRGRLAGPDPKLQSHFPPRCRAPHVSARTCRQVGPASRGRNRRQPLGLRLIGCRTAPFAAAAEEHSAAGRAVGR